MGPCAFERTGYAAFCSLMTPDSRASYVLNNVETSLIFIAQRGFPKMNQHDG